MKAVTALPRSTVWIRLGLSILGGLCAITIQEFFPPARYLITLSPGHVFPAIVTFAWGFPWGFLSTLVGQFLILCYAPDVNSILWALVPVLWLSVHGLWRDMARGRYAWLFNTYALEVVLRTVILYSLVVTGIVLNPFHSWSEFSLSVIAVSGPGAIVVREVMWAFLVIVSADLLSRYLPFRNFRGDVPENPSVATLIILWLCLIILVVEYLAWHLYLPAGELFPDSELRGRLFLKLFFVMLAAFIGFIISWGTQRRNERLSQMEFLARNIEVGLLVTGKGRVVYSNLEFRRIFLQTKKSLLPGTGIPLEDMFGRQFEITPGNIPGLCETGGPLPGEYIFRDSSGAVRHVRLWFRERRESGHGIMFYLFAQDVTEWRNAEEALRQSEEKFLIAFDESPVLLCITRQSDGTFIHVNHAFEKVFEYPRDVVIGRTSLELNIWDNPGDRVELIYDLLRQGSPVSREVHFRKRNGGLFIGETSAISMDFGGERCLLLSVHDVTEKRMVEKKLRENELRILEIVQGIAIPTMVIDSDCRVIQWNSACESFFGVTADRMLGTRNHWSCFYKEERPMLVDLIVKGASEEEFERLYPGNWRISRLVEGGVEGDGYFPGEDGQGMWLFFTAAPLRDPEGRVIGAIETIIDMTERHLAEESLRESEQRYRDLYESMGDALIRLDLSRRIVQVNASALSLFGYELESWPGMDSSELFTIESCSVYNDIITQVRGRGYSDLVEARMLRRGGSSFDAEIRAYAMRDDSGQRVGSWAIVRDLTERKRSEAILQSQHDLAFILSTITEKDRALAVLLSSAMTYQGIDCGGIYEIDQDSGDLLLGQSRGLSKVFNGHMKRITAKSPVWRYFWDDNDHYWDYEDLEFIGFGHALEEGLKTVGIIPMSHRGVLVSGILVGSRTSGNIPREARKALEALVSHAGSAMARIGVEEELRIVNDRLEGRVRERTEELLSMNNRLHESLETLNRTRDQLVQAEKMAALGGLVAGVAHEINTPVGIGVTASSFLRDEGEKYIRKLSAGTTSIDEQKRFAELVVEASSSILTNLIRAAELVSSFKQVAVDQSTEERRSFFVREYIEEVIMSLHSRIKRGKHRVEVLCEDNLVIDSYPGVFAQIITNLVMNSLIHGFGQKQEGIISLEFTRRGDNLLFLYRDNGSGMDSETLKRAFDPFFTTRRGQGGTGLGLHIVFNLVTGKLGGTISVESETDMGCLFTLDIPIKGM